jgi:uncharacterized repeat protein (TIGR03943 family)
MNLILQRLLPAALLTVWGTVFCAMYFTGRISAYLIPAFRPYALAAGVILVIFAALLLVCPRRIDPTGCSSKRTPFRAAIATFLLTVPLLVAFTKSPDSFGASAVSNRIYVQDIDQLPGSQPPGTVEPALPESDPSAAPPSNAGTDDQYGFPKNANGIVEAQVVDFLYAAQLPEMRSQLENKPVEVIGQLMPAKENNPKGDRYDVIRMVMTCCAADARPMALAVQPSAKPAVREMTWVKVSGTATFPVIGGQRVPVIQNGVIEKTEPPEEVYLY